MECGWFSFLIEVLFAFLPATPSGAPGLITDGAGCFEDRLGLSDAIYLEGLYQSVLSRIRADPGDNIRLGAYMRAL